MIHINEKYHLPDDTYWCSTSYYNGISKIEKSHSLVSKIGERIHEFKIIKLIRLDVLEKLANSSKK